MSSSRWELRVKVAALIVAILRLALEAYKLLR